MGHEILKQLSKAFHSNPGSISFSSKINRLPDENGEWYYNSWLVEPSLFDDVSLLFPDRNIVTPSTIGGDKIAEMAMVTRPMWADTDDLITQLIKISQKEPSNIDKNQLSSV